MDKYQVQMQNADGTWVDVGDPITDPIAAIDHFQRNGQTDANNTGRTWRLAVTVQATALIAVPDGA